LHQQNSTKRKSFEDTSTSTNAIEKKIWPRKRKFAQQSKIKNKRQVKKSNTKM
jgi:hypothetical protein